MKPTFQVITSNGTRDYSAFIAEIKPVREDLDANGSGRNLLDGLMYRKRIAQKDKWTVNFLDIPETIVHTLAADIGTEYVSVKMLAPEVNRYLTKTYYVSKLDYGAQMYDPGKGLTMYKGVTFNMIER